MDKSPSGQQVEVSWENQRAVVVEVGGGIRLYEVGGRPVLDPYPIDAICDGAHGTPLIPWPNRLKDGQYHFDGKRYQVPLTEPEKHNAIHGLLRWRPWQILRQSAAGATMGIRLFPMQGYPFLLEVGECEIEVLRSDGPGSAKVVRSSFHGLSADGQLTLVVGKDACGSLNLQRALID